MDGSLIRTLGDDPDANSITYHLGDRNANRMGYGAMQLAGPRVFGPPKDHNAAIAVLREAVARRQHVNGRQ